MKELTQKYLKEALDYNPETGVFIWLERPREHFKSDHGFKVFSSQKTGNVAGFKYDDGYLIIGIGRKEYAAHRLAFLYQTGSFPPEQVDHKNHNRSDNKWKNLRPATKQENAMNKKMRPKNTSGFNGVHFCKNSNKWIARVGIKGKRKHLGYFANIEEAIECRKAANIKYGFYKNHGLAQDELSERP